MHAVSSRYPWKNSFLRVAKMALATAPTLLAMACADATAHAQVSMRFGSSGSGRHDSCSATCMCIEGLMVG